MPLLLIDLTVPNTRSGNSLEYEPEISPSNIVGDTEIRSPTFALRLPLPMRVETFEGIELIGDFDSAEDLAVLFRFFFEVKMLLSEMSVNVRFFFLLLNHLNA